MAKQYKSNEHDAALKFMHERWRRVPNEGFDAYIRHNMIVSGANTVEEKEIILDVGCGLGILGRSFENNNRLIVYADMQLEFLKHFPKTRYLGERILCDGRFLPFKTSSFDLILCSDVVEHVHVNQRYSFLAEIARVAKRYVLLTISTFYSETRGIPLFTTPFKVLGLPYPEWYLEHCRSIGPTIPKILNFLKNNKLNIVDLKLYQGLISIFFTGLLSVLNEVSTRGKRGFKKIWSPIIFVSNALIYILVLFLDIPPYCSYYLKLHKEQIN